MESMTKQRYSKEFVTALEQFQELEKKHSISIKPTDSFLSVCARQHEPGTHPDNSLLFFRFKRLQLYHLCLYPLKS